MIRSLTALVLGLTFAAGVPAADEQAPEQFVEVPPPPAIIHGDDGAEAMDDELEPEVTIIEREDASYEEYRLNGRLYMVKVVPAVGPPYYYIDNDGDGLMETRTGSPMSRTGQPEVPQWVIFSW